MFSNYNEGKIGKRFISFLENKIYKYRPSISKRVYIDKLNGNVMFQIGLEKFFLIQKLKIMFRGHFWNVLRKKIAKIKSKRV